MVYNGFSFPIYIVYKKVISATSKFLPISYIIDIIHYLLHYRYYPPALKFLDTLSPADFIITAFSLVSDKPFQNFWKNKPRNLSLCRPAPLVTSRSRIEYNASLSILDHKLPVKDYLIIIIFRNRTGANLDTISPWSGASIPAEFDKNFSFNNFWWESLTDN